MQSPANTVLIYGRDSTGAGVPVGTTGSTQATSTLTSDNTNVSNGDTVTIGGVTYTFKTALTPTDGEVKIGADADGSLLNLINAINDSGAKINGTDFYTLRRGGHPLVTAATSVTAHTFAITARDAGVQGNLIATTETSSHLSWTGAVMSGGADGSIAIASAGTSRTASCTAATSSGSTTAGVRAVTFLASSDFSGTVLGQAFAASATLSLSAPQGDTLGAMAYTRSAGTLYIYYLT